MKKIWLGFIITMVLLIGVAINGCSSNKTPSSSSKPPETKTSEPATPAKPTPKQIVLKSVTFVPKTVFLVEPFLNFAKIINERSKGELTINNLGGPEVITGYEQIEALRSGTIDFYLAPGSYVEGLIPEVSVLSESKISPAEERKVGFYDLMVDLHKKQKMQYLGRAGAITPSYFFTRFPVQSKEDFKGKKIRGYAQFSNFLTAIGAVPTMVPPMELFSALERGVLDGHFASIPYTVTSRWHEPIKYLVDVPFEGQESNMYFAMNLDAWNKLPANLQKLVSDVALEIENQIYSDDIKKLEAPFREKMVSSGVKFVKLPDSDAASLNKTIDKSLWDHLGTKVPTDTVQKMQKMISR